MKKIYFLLFALMSFNYLFAQPSLQWIRPPFGTLKNYTMYQGTMPTPTEGANQTWDYSSYNPTAIFGLQYMDFSTLPQSAKDKFPTSTYVEAMPGISLNITIINYYQEFTDSLKRLGQQGSGGGLANTWGDIEAVFNISYGDSTTTNTIIKYAAYGTLKTKYGTYNNVVMLKRGTSTFLYQTTPYFAPLMQIVYNAGSIVGSYIFYYASSSGLNENKASSIAIYPNPVNETLSFISPESYNGLVYYILDMNGKQILTGTIENAITSIDLSKFASGNYILKTNDISLKFIKQ
ncbi:MAG: T9SS type A sorting domain-containing protein [Bacteroidales bacterium]